MRIESLNAFEAIDFPKHNSLSLAEEVSSFESWNMPEISLDLKNAELPYAAKSSLERHFTIADNGTPVLTQKDPALKPEEFILERNEESVKITASDDSGFRYGVCELEERIRNGEYGTFREVPTIPRRITRCFFAPNTRPPLKLDELRDDYASCSMKEN